MKKLLFFVAISFPLTVANGQLYPVKNLNITGSYQYQNYNCPSFNCFEISWSAPDSSSADTLIGYNMYQNDTLYSFFNITTTVFGCPGWAYPGCSFTTPIWFGFLPPHDAHPFWVTVKAVYNKDSTTSIAPDSIYFAGIVVGLTENISKKYFKILPNPFSTRTTLVMDYLCEDATLRIYNAYGQLIRHEINISGQSINFCRDNLPSGIYFLRLTQDNRIIATEKLVIIDN